MDDSGGWFEYNTDYVEPDDVTRKLGPTNVFRGRTTQMSPLFAIHSVFRIAELVRQACFHLYNHEPFAIPGENVRLVASVARLPIPSGNPIALSLQVPMS